MLIKLLVIGALGWLAMRWLSKISQAAGPAKSAGSAGRQTSKATSGTNNDPYSILEVARDATADEIKAAYQKKVREYHPDQVAQMGQELQELAEKRTKEINAAYTRLKQ